MVVDWFVKGRILETLDYVVFSNDEVDLDDMYSYIVTFFFDDMGLSTIHLDNINLDDDNFGY